MGSRGASLGAAPAACGPGNAMRAKIEIRAKTVLRGRRRWQQYQRECSREDVNAEIESRCMGREGAVTAPPRFIVEILVNISSIGFTEASDKRAVEIVIRTTIKTKQEVFDGDKLGVNAM